MACRSFENSVRSKQSWDHWSESLELERAESREKAQRWVAEELRSRKWTAQNLGARNKADWGASGGILVMAESAAVDALLVMLARCCLMRRSGRT